MTKKLTVEESEVNESMVKAQEETTVIRTGEPVPVAYVGPTIPKVTTKGTVYANGLPDKLSALMEKHNILRSLLVPVTALSDGLREINAKGSGMNLLYKEAEKLIKGGV